MAPLGFLVPCPEAGTVESPPPGGARQKSHEWRYRGSARRRLLRHIDQGGAKLEILDQGIISFQRERRAYCPSVKQLRNGCFIASQDVGTTLGSCDHSIEILHSRDGWMWESEGILPGGAADDQWFYRAPDLEELPDGRIVMRATRFEVADGEIFDPDDETLVRGQALLYWSEDQGRSWSAPQIVPVNLPPERFTWNGAGARLLCLSASRWMYPLETFRPRGSNAPLDQKAIAVFSGDQGKTWGELTTVAEDPSGRLFWWDQMCTQLPDSRIYTMFWTHVRGTSDDLPVHYAVSEDEGRTWSPIAFSDGRVAAIYNYRHMPQGIRVVLSHDLCRFDLENELIIFDADTEATLGETDYKNYLAEHLQISFGKPSAILLDDGTLLAYFWCTSNGVTHTRWVRVECS